MADKPIDPLAVIQMLASAWKQAVPAAPLVPESETPSARMMAQALAAANMPSREEVSEIAARLGRIEESLARIERTLAAPKPRKSTKGKH